LEVVVKMLKNFLILLINIYQKLFSFDHAFWANPDRFRICIYQPSCSEYTKNAIKKFGAIKGLWMGLLRFISCNPTNHGGYDPLPDKPSLLRRLFWGGKDKE
jgi:hypothetical protein